MLEYQAEIERLKLAGKQERLSILQGQWGNIQKIADYLTQAVAALPEGNSIEAVHAGVHELIRQYDLLIFQSTVDAETFSMFVTTLIPTTINE